jgi:rSAM/selenodomain-associated transferase 2
MKISVIIPTLNEETTIQSLVGFVLRYGTPSVAEVIVVDGSSTDNTVAFAISSGATTLVCDKRSRASQLNLGANNARGEILYFIHADVKPPESFVNDILRAHGDGYEAGCYRFKFDSAKFMLKINSYFTRFNSIMCRGGDQTLFISKDLFSRLGGFDDYYTIMEDYDLIQKIRRSARFKIIPKTVLVSPRKYEHNSWLRVQAANFIVFMMFFMGSKPSSMKSAYERMLNYK